MGADGGKGGRDRLPWTIAAIAVVALVGNLLWGQKDDDVDQETIARLTERLDALEDAPPPSRARNPASGIRPAGASAPRGASGMIDEPRTPEEIAAARERQLRELEAQFARDVPDPATGPATENLLVETISGATMAGTGLRPANVDIACKQSSCRIVGSFDRMGDAQDWSLFYITAAGGNVLSQTRMVFVPKPDGRTEVRIYSNRAKG
jgi:hypothetical protein